MEFWKQFADVASRSVPTPVLDALAGAADHRVGSGLTADDRSGLLPHLQVFRRRLLVPAIPQTARQVRHATLAVTAHRRRCGRP